MNIVVTGGTGFIGRHLVRRLIELPNTSITVLDNLHRSVSEGLPYAHPGFRFVKADIRDRDALLDALRGADVIYHLAAQSSVMSANADPHYTFTTNVVGTINVLEAARLNKVKRTIFASSREVYGDCARLPVPETAPFNPKNGYGTSKAAAEMYCRMAQSEGIEVVVLRLTNVYGTGDRDRVLPLFIEESLHDRPLRLFGGKQVIDFVWIDSVIEALRRVGLGQFIAEPLNIGSGKGSSLSDVCRRVVVETRARSPVDVLSCREVEVSRFVADITRATEVLGLQPPSDPLFGLTHLIDAARHSLRGRPHAVTPPSLQAS